jgi:hypothetical protein
LIGVTHDAQGMLLLSVNTPMPIGLFQPVIPSGYTVRDENQNDYVAP